MAKEPILSGLSRSEQVAMIAPVAGSTLRCGTLSSFAVRRTVYHHTVSRGTRCRLLRAVASRKWVFQRKDSAIIAGHRCSINYISVGSGSARRRMPLRRKFGSYFQTEVRSTVNCKPQWTAEICPRISPICLIPHCARSGNGKALPEICNSGSLSWPHTMTSMWVQLEARYVFQDRRRLE